jgi:predicted nucleic acid-binding protein
MRFVDTNVFVRMLTGDDPVKEAYCAALFERVRDGDEQIATSEAVIAEIAFVLSSKNTYGLAAEEVRDRLKPLVALPGLRLPYKQTCLRALEIFATAPMIGFDDALIVAHMERQGITELLSYDRHFDCISNVQRIEP